MGLGRAGPFFAGASIAFIAFEQVIGECLLGGAELRFGFRHRLDIGRLRTELLQCAARGNLRDACRPWVVSQGLR